MEMKIIRKEEKGQSGKIFLQAHQLCNKDYIRLKMLEDGEKMDLPDLYFIAVENRQVVSSIGLFEKNLPLNEAFFHESETRAVELGRFNPRNKIEKNRKIMIANNILNTLFGFLRDNNIENIYMQTHKAIIEKLAIYCTLDIQLEKISDDINWGNIPQKNMIFYRRYSPSLWKITITEKIS